MAREIGTVTAYVARKSIATLLREWAEQHGHLYEARMVAGLLAYFVADQRVDRDVLLHGMDTGAVALCPSCARSTLAGPHRH